MTAPIIRLDSDMRENLHRWIRTVALTAILFTGSVAASHAQIPRTSVSRVEVLEQADREGWRLRVTLLNEAVYHGYILDRSDHVVRLTSAGMPISRITRIERGTSGRGVIGPGTVGAVFGTIAALAWMSNCHGSGCLRAGVGLGVLLGGGAFLGASAASGIIDAVSPEEARIRWTVVWPRE